VSVSEISGWQQEVRKPFDSVGMVCSCGIAVAGIEGVIIRCGECGAAYIISVMQLREIKA
jgi:predicted RNA-binding Zn-ribbon protein involved in translation (DUF1610 family)